MDDGKRLCCPVWVSMVDKEGPTGLNRTVVVNGNLSMATVASAWSLGTTLWASVRSIRFIGTLMDMTLALYADSLRKVNRESPVALAIPALTRLEVFEACWVEDGVVLMTGDVGTMSSMACIGAIALVAPLET